jgi:hypothetical protein
MMPLRLYAFIAALVWMLSSPVFASDLAPADEYFGPFRVSILEIRNRLIGFERDTSADLARHLRAIDNVELAIEDWHHRYPRDPWIHGFSVRLAHVYQRAHAWRTAGCRRIVHIAHS